MQIFNGTVRSARSAEKINDGCVCFIGRGTDDAGGFMQQIIAPHVALQRFAIQGDVRKIIDQQSSIASEVAINRDTVSGNKLTNIPAWDLRRRTDKTVETLASVRHL